MAMVLYILAYWNKAAFKYCEMWRIVLIGSLLNQIWNFDQMWLFNIKQVYHLTDVNENAKEKWRSNINTTSNSIPYYYFYLDITYNNLSRLLLGFSI